MMNKDNTKVNLIAALILVLTLYAPGLKAQTFYKGVDLSYVNEMEDAGIVYKDNNVVKDVYQIFSDYGANLVRVRLWHNPTWTNLNSDGKNYSGLADAKKTIRRSKDKGMAVLLDFHYSDTWTDPSKQWVPSAWAALTTTDQLKTALYNYTYNTLTELDNEGLMPEFVQIGNETNGNMCVTEGATSELYPVDFARQATLMNAGIQAVKDVGAVGTITPKTVIHIAEPKKVYSFFQNAVANGLSGFDIIGISYYPVWHTDHTYQGVGQLVKSLKTDFGKDVMIVETGHTWTVESMDNANNVMSGSASGFAAPSPEVQKDFLIKLSNAVAANGGIGVIYWEPAWVSSPATTLWGTGSHWENATFFDFSNDVMLPGGMQFLSEDYEVGQEPAKVSVTFKVDMAGVDTSNGVYVTGDFTSNASSNWAITQMTLEAGTVYTYTALMEQNANGAYYFLNSPTNWGSRETVPLDCATKWDKDREYNISSSAVTYAFKWGSCEPASGTTYANQILADRVSLFPNPSSKSIYVKCEDEITSIAVFSPNGALVDSFAQTESFNVSGYANGVYYVRINNRITKSFVKQ